MHEPMNLPARRATQGSREALVTVENPPLVDVNYSSIVELRLQRAAQRECWAEVVRRLCMHNMGCKPDMGDGATHLPRSAKNRSAFHPQCAGDEFGQQCGRRRPVRDGEFITNCTWYLCLVTAILPIHRPARWIGSDIPTNPRQRRRATDDMFTIIALPDHRAWRTALFVDAFGGHRSKCPHQPPDRFAPGEGGS